VDLHGVPDASGQLNETSAILKEADKQFVLALGNRPKGERGLYLVTLWVYAVLALYLIVCSVILSIRAFKDVLGIDGSIGDKLLNMFKQTNGVLIAAVMSTIGELTFAPNRRES
jgi:chitin synthase